MTPLAIAGVAGGGLIAAGLFAVLVRRGREGRIDDAEDAAEAAGAQLRAFDPVGAVVGADGAGALAVARDGRVAVMKRRGRHIRAREVPWSALTSTPAGIVVTTPERWPGTVTLPEITALDVRRLAPQQSAG